MTASLIGARIQRKEDYRFLTGAGMYTDDVALPGQAYAAFVRSPHAHARIKKIAVDQAKKSPAVLAVYTGADLKGYGALKCVPPLKNRDAVKLITRALRSGDFIVTPDFGSLSHLKYFYDRPKSLHVVDIAVMTLDHGTIASTDIRLRLMPSDN